MEENGALPQVLGKVWDIEGVSESNYMKEPEVTRSNCNGIGQRKHPGKPGCTEMINQGLTRGQPTGNTATSSASTCKLLEQLSANVSSPWPDIAHKLAMATVEKVCLHQIGPGG